MDPRLIGALLVFAGLADGVALLILGKRLEGKPNREVVLGSIGLTSLVLIVVGALLASGRVVGP